MNKFAQSMSGLLIGSGLLLGCHQAGTHSGKSVGCAETCVQYGTPDSNDHDIPSHQNQLPAAAPPAYMPPPAQAPLQQLPPAEPRKLLPGESPKEPAPKPPSEDEFLPPRKEPAKMPVKEPVPENKESAASPIILPPHDPGLLPVRVDYFPVAD